jgi:hypothetical protein
MEQITEPQIDLFAANLPSMDEIRKLSEFVHSSERNQLNFSEQAEQDIGKTGPKASLAAGIGLFILGRNAEAADKLQKAKNLYTWPLRFVELPNSTRQLKTYKAVSTMRPIH